MADLNELIRQYPAFAVMTSIPEVAALLQQPGITATNFIAKLVGTNWWRTTSKSQRDWLGLQFGDPAEATRQSNQRSLAILQMASSLGINLTLQQSADLSNQSLREGWDTARLQFEVSRSAREGKTSPGGLEATRTTLRGIATNQGVTVSDHTTFDWAQKIAMGTASQDGYSSYIKDVARWMHPYWEHEIQKGATVRQLADPYIQQASQILEIAPDQVDLSNPKWNFAHKDKAGNQQPMTQLDWQRKLMTEPQYAYDKTGGARTAAFQMVDQLKKSFGAA